MPPRDNARRFGRPNRGHKSRPAWLFALDLIWQDAEIRPRGWATLALLSVFASSALAAASPVILKLTVDYLAEQGMLEGSPWYVGFLISGYAASHWLARLFGELRSFALGRAEQRLYRGLSSRLFEHVMNLPLRFHLDRQTGALSQTLTNGLLGYRILTQHLLLTVLPIVVELIMVSAVLVTLEQPAFLTIIGFSLICYASVFYFGAARLTIPARSVSNARIEANALLTDSILNYEAIKSFAAESHVHRRMEQAFSRTERHWARFFSRKALTGVVTSTVFALFLGISVYVGANAVQENRMSLGDFVMVNAYMLQVFRPMEMLGMAVRDVVQGMAFIADMIGVFREAPERAAQSRGTRLGPGPGELRFDAVSFSHSPGHPILQDVTFTVAAGTTVALVGASGSGKTSLIRLLLRLLEPDSGRILLDDIPIAEIAVSSLRCAIAIVPQDVILLNDTIANNIAIGRGDSSAEEIVRAAEAANIHEFIRSQPEGYETFVGERGLKLSGGEKQRIAIARAVLRNPRIFVFDEATSSLDVTTERRILRNLRRISRTKTTLMVAHRLSAIVDAEEILVLDQGKIVERGTHQGLLQYDSAYKFMWCMQNESNQSRSSGG